MALSMHQASVPVLVRALSNLREVLRKGEKHAAAAGYDPALLLQLRQAPDMFPLLRQVQIAADFAKGTTARLAGIEVPRYEDNEQSFSELQQRITKTLGFVDAVLQAEVDAGAQRAITHGTGERARHFPSGEAYVTRFALPNFFFHVTTAYAILRHNGVPIGKKDFIGEYE